MKDAVSILEHIKTMLDEREKALSIRFEEQEKALNLTARALEIRLEHLNNVRDEGIQDRMHFLLKEVYQKEHQILIERIERVQTFQNKLMGVFLFVTFVVGLVSAFHFLFK